MAPILLNDIGFWEVIWYMLIIFFWMIFFWMFISVFADILRRRDHHGLAKAGWVLLIVVVPFFGILIYLIARPKHLEQDAEMMQQAQRSAGVTSTDEIAQAHQLLQSGAITQAEFDQIKERALA